ncbi:hypothetical protein NDU88_004892 [Pleurodeles waltl]|uniref:Uncharacterized protein n=1 Tax=Pleurodeles waltl TaxID=8319 RepID=A0AAV7RJI3_PLEWA|nr:hypothetical protein NDU88_004892 [Pleurodeles waltl]
MHCRALKVGPHKGKAPIQRNALMIMGRGKHPEEDTEEKNEPMRGRRLPKWEAARPAHADREIHLPGEAPKGNYRGESRSASGDSQNGSPLRSARLKRNTQVMQQSKASARSE